MNSLPIELKILIAGSHKEVWVRMWTYDENFRERAELVRKTFLGIFSTLRVNEDGIQTWWVLGKCHRGNDLPAAIFPDGHTEWWQNGLRHRENDLPAVICPAGGKQEWWIKGQLHRENDLPAVVYANGNGEWWKNHKRHRDGDKPAVIFVYGIYTIQEWWKNGVFTSANWTEKLERRLSKRNLG